MPLKQRTPRREAEEDGGSSELSISVEKKSHSHRTSDRLECHGERNIENCRKTDFKEHTSEITERTPRKEFEQDERSGELSVSVEKKPHVHETSDCLERHG